MNPVPARVPTSPRLAFFPSPAGTFAAFRCPSP